MNRKGAVIFVAVALIMAAIFGIVFSEAKTQLGTSQEETVEQGTDVYGNETAIVSSDDCYETCATTADSRERRQLAVLITLDEREIWTNGYKLSQSVPGYDIDAAIRPAIEQGLVIEREGVMSTEYRYVGPDGEYANAFTQSQLEIWIADQLNAYNGWYTLEELTASMPAGETEVARAVGALKGDGVVQQGRESEGTWIATTHTVYAHHTVTKEPYHAPGIGGILPVFGVVLLAVLVIGVVQRFRHRE